MLTPSKCRLLNGKMLFLLVVIQFLNIYLLNAQQVDCPSIWQQGIMGDCIGENAMATADIDKDGKTELIIGTSRTWYVLKWSDEYKDYQVLLVGNYIEFLETMVVLDADYDNDLEVVVGTSHGEVLFFDAATGSPEGNINVNTTYSSIYKVLMADADNDGNTELVACTAYSTFFYSRINNGYVLKFSIEEGAMDLAIGNVDGLPGNELVYATGKIFKLEHQQPVLVWMFDDNYNNNANLLLEDMDADGMSEIIYSGQYSVFGVYDADIKQAKWIKNFWDIDEILIADADGDGIRELIVGKVQTDSVYGLSLADASRLWLVRGNGSGTAFICVDDLDNDGVQELAWTTGCYHTGEDYMEVYSLPEFTHEWTSKSIWGPFSVEVENVDEDPFDEVIIVGTVIEPDLCCDDVFISIYDAQTRKPEWTSDTSLVFENLAITDFTFGKVADVDGDGKQEIIVAANVWYSPTMWIVDPVAHTIKSSHTWSLDMDDMRGFSIADMDLNGTNEFIIATQNKIYVVNPLDWSITWQSEKDNSAFFSDVSVDNIDADPEPEIIVNSMKIVVYDQNGVRWETADNHFTRFTTYDINGDGMKEIVAGNWNGELAVINGITHSVDWLPVDGGDDYITGLMVADITATPEPELIFALDGKVFFSTLDGQMISTGQIDTDGARMLFEIADYDYDGKPDVFAGTHSQVIEWDRQCWECLTFRSDISATSAACGLANGTATVIPKGGYEPFYISWSTGETTTEISNLPAGNYSCELMDSHQCVINMDVTVNEIPFIADSLLVTPDNTATGDCEGSVSIYPAGGAAPYRYAWHNDSLNYDTVFFNDTTVLSNNLIRGLCAGEHEMLIIDANNCSDRVTFRIGEITEIPQVEYDFRVYPVPTRDYVILETIITADGNTVHGYPVNGTAEIQTIHGKIIFRLDISDELTRINLTPLPTGLYMLKMKINNQERVYKIEKVY